MQNNILLPNSNTAPLTGMSRSEDAKPDHHHDIPENDPHFLDSSFKRGLIKLGRKVGIVEKPRKLSVTQQLLAENPVLQSQHPGGKKRKESVSTRSNSHPENRAERSVFYEDLPNAPMTEQSLRKDNEDARVRRMSMQG